VSPFEFNAMQQKTYPIDEHLLPLNKVDSEALYVMEKLRQAGHTAYLVGGSVRDLLLQKKPKDFDISTSAKPEEIKQLFRNCILIGKRFRLAHIRFGKKILEVSTFRSGDNVSDTLILRDNVWGTPEEDVLRRDFTINGLFYDPATQTIIDFVGGYPDIERKYLRTIGQPFVRFKQDPVRMIRLLKFQARFGFEIDPEALIALVECRGEILKSSSARILEELLRMLESTAACSFVRLMTEHGLLQLMMPALAHYLETNDGEDVYSFLEEIDTTFHALPQVTLPRPILLSSLLFSLFQQQISLNYLDRNRVPHLGEIQEEAHLLIDTVFRPFFHLPRRLRAGIVSILTSQYRLTPIEKKKGRRLRVPNDPDFPLAMKFFDIRRCLEPGLEKLWEDWQEVYKEPTPERVTPRKRRRKTRRPSTEQT
jgi:poly(A) polymerase